MNDFVTVILSGAIGGAVVSSIIGPFLDRYRERRTIRADVLRALMDVERARWASEKSTYDHYLQAVQKLRAAALIARAYRPLVEFYVQASALARSGSDDDFDSDKREFNGSIDSDVADFVSHTAEALSDYLWHPYFYRLSVKSKLEELGSRRTALRRKYNAKKPVSDHIYDWERHV